MSGQDSEPSASYVHQIGELTKSVSRHDQTLEGLKEVPQMLKNLMQSLAPHDEDDVSGDAGLDFMNTDDSSSRDNETGANDGSDMAKGLGFDDSEIGNYI